jgi:hypothetical protein
MATPDPAQFMTASLLERAVLLLCGSFREPVEPVSRVNVADAIANAAGVPNTAGITGGQIMGGGSPNPTAYRLVSEAWQVLEQARLICPDLSPGARVGDWWVLTATGIAARDSTDPEGSIRLALNGF